MLKFSRILSLKLFEIDSSCKKFWNNILPKTYIIGSGFFSKELLKEILILKFWMQNFLLKK